MEATQHYGGVPPPPGAVGPALRLSPGDIVEVTVAEAEQLWWQVGTLWGRGHHGGTLKAMAGRTPKVGTDPTVGNSGEGQPPKSVPDPRGESRASCVHRGPDEIPPISIQSNHSSPAHGVGHDPPTARMPPPPQLC